MNKYSPFTFFGLLMIPIAFGVVHAQDSNSASNTKDPFDIMFNQAREQQRQKITQEFTESQKQNEMANMQNASPFGKGPNTSQGGQGAQSNTNQPPNVANPSNTPSSPQSAASPNIPAANVNPTNTQQPSAPVNIYAPPPAPSSVPSTTGQPQQQAPVPSQKPTNVYE